MKYTEEGRFCLGICVDIKENENGEMEYVGKRLPLYDYTGKTLLTAPDFDELIRKES